MKLFQVLNSVNNQDLKLRMIKYERRGTNSKTLSIKQIYDGSKEKQRVCVCTCTIVIRENTSIYTRVAL